MNSKIWCQNNNWRNLKKMSGRWGWLFSSKCAEGRGNTTHTSEACYNWIFISGVPRMIKRWRCQFHKLLNLSANCTIKMSVLDSGLCRIELTINSFKSIKRQILIKIVATNIWLQIGSKIWQIYDSNWLQFPSRFNPLRLPASTII